MARRLPNSTKKISRQGRESLISAFPTRILSMTAPKAMVTKKIWWEVFKRYSSKPYESNHKENTLWKALGAQNIGVWKSLTSDCAQECNIVQPIASQMVLANLKSWRSWFNRAGWSSICNQPQGKASGDEQIAKPPRKKNCRPVRIPSKVRKVSVSRRSKTRAISGIFYLVAQVATRETIPSW